jgi:hypothetical protein
MPPFLAPPSSAWIVNKLIAAEKINLGVSDISVGRVSLEYFHECTEFIKKTRRRAMHHH